MGCVYGGEGNFQLFALRAGREGLTGIGGGEECILINVVSLGQVNAAGERGTLSTHTRVRARRWIGGGGGEGTCIYGYINGCAARDGTKAKGGRVVKEVCAGCGIGVGMFGAAEG